MPLTLPMIEAQPVQIWIGEGGFQFVGIQVSRLLEPLRVEMVILINTPDGAEVIRTGDIRPLAREHWFGKPIADPHPVTGGEKAKPTPPPNVNAYESDEGRQ